MSGSPWDTCSGAMGRTGIKIISCLKVGRTFLGPEATACQERSDSTSDFMARVVGGCDVIS